MYANGGDAAHAIRPLADALTTGQTLQVVLENGWISPSNSVGFALENSGGESLFECYFYGGEPSYRVKDSLGILDSGVGYTDQGITITFALTGMTNYDARISGTNVVNLSGDLVDRTDSSIRRLRFWNYSAGVGENYNAYFNNLLVTEDAPGGMLQDTVEIFLVDPDNNIPDWWLIEHFGSVTAQVARIDSDFDGHLNQHEFWLGTDPTNALSSLVIENVEVTASDDHSITWKSVGGRLYDVQYSDTLSTSMVFNTVITVQESSVSNGVVTSHTFVDSISPPAADGVRVYRVKLRR